MSTKRDSWGSKWGFILACIGSAVGMGNIWLFPARISAYGGATFLIPYLIFVVIIGSTGVIGEMAFGRATRSGPIGAFGAATKKRWGNDRPGKLLGLIPVLGSLALAIGYSVVTGWIFRYLAGSFTGTVLNQEGLDGFNQLFNATASNNLVWQLVGMAITILILIFGIGKGIEQANKVMTPLFFVLFVGLAIYLMTLPAAWEGYRYIFVLDPKGLLDPLVWVYALGQAFFSLSVAGNGTLIYGSYLSKDSNIPADARMVAIFDTLAAMLAALVIIPAMAVAGQQLNQSGPGLMFIYLVNVFNGMPGGKIVGIIFYICVLFAGMSSLVNLYEAPVATLQERFGLKRVSAVGIIAAFGCCIALLIQGIVSGWMDAVSIYICPLGAMLAAIMFFWIADKEFALKAVNTGREKKIGTWFLLLGKYVLVPLALIALIAGAVLGGIG